MADTVLVSLDVWSKNQLKGEKKQDRIRKKEKMKELRNGWNQMNKWMKWECNSVSVLTSFQHPLPFHRLTHFTLRLASDILSFISDCLKNPWKPVSPNQIKSPDTCCPFCTLKVIVVSVDTQKAPSKARATLSWGAFPSTTAVAWSEQALRPIMHTLHYITDTCPIIQYTFMLINISLYFFWCTDL